MLHYPEGTYGVEIPGQKLSKTSNGNPMVSISFKPYSVQGPNNPEGTPTWINLSITDYERTTYLVVTEKAVDYVCRKLANIGIVLTDWGQVDQAHPQCRSAIGQRVVVECRHEEYQRKNREKWESPLPANTASVEPLTGVEVAEMNALYGDALKKMHDKEAMGEHPVAEEPEEERPTSEDLSEAGM